MAVNIFFPISLIFVGIITIGIVVSLFWLRKKKLIKNIPSDQIRELNYDSDNLAKKKAIKKLSFDSQKHFDDYNNRKEVNTDKNDIEKEEKIRQLKEKIREGEHELGLEDSRTSERREPEIQERTPSVKATDELGSKRSVQARNDLELTKNRESNQRSRQRSRSSPSKFKPI